MFGKIYFILGPSWPGTYTELASDADYVCFGGPFLAGHTYWTRFSCHFLMLGDYWASSLLKFDFIFGPLAGHVS